MTDSAKIRLVLADDQPMIRQGLNFIVNAQPDMEVVGEASDGEEAVTVTLETAPDLVLMDIQMPRRTGIEATKTILQSLPFVKVILLTTFDVQDYVFDGIRAGAAGYLLKDADTAALLEGVRSVYHSEALYRSATACDALARVREHSITGDKELNLDISEPLTERELAVLQEMAYGRRNSEIAALLHVSEGTVKTHVHRILGKLGVQDRTQAVVLAIRSGLVR